jgi:predicted acylesterase/phospholipase RssA
MLQENKNNSPVSNTLATNRLATNTNESNTNESNTNESNTNESNTNESNTNESDTNTDESMKNISKNTQLNYNNKENYQDTSSYDTLVLAGGSIKGFMTIGAIQYLHDNFSVKNIKNFIGTSSGSIICFLLAIGYTPVEIIVYSCTNQLMEKMNTLNIVAMIQGRGVSSFNHIQEQLEKMTIVKIGYLPTLNDLKENYGKTLIATTHNLTENRTEYLSWKTHPNLPCITAIRMSSNLPLIFENYKYGNSLYVDGGISDNFPIDMGEKIGNKVIGIILDNKPYKVEIDSEYNTLEFIYKIIFIPMQQSNEWKIRNAKEKTHIVRINHSSINTKFFEFDISSKYKLEMFSIGYEKMRKEFE